MPHSNLNDQISIQDSKKDNLKTTEHRLSSCRVFGAELAKLPTSHEFFSLEKKIGAFFGFHFFLMAEARKSAYELQREKNIEANNAVLRSLGLLVEKQKDESTVARASKQNKEKDVSVLPHRKSARLNNIPTVHQEVYVSSDEDDCNSSRKRKAKDAPSKDFVPSRKSNRRSRKIFPQVNYDFDDEDSDDDFEAIVFNVMDGDVADEHAKGATDAHSAFDFDPYGFDTDTSANVRFSMSNDGATTPYGVSTDPYSRPMFVHTMFFMDSDTVLCPQV